MSWRTQCNRCTLEQIKKDNPMREVEVRKMNRYPKCDLQVFVGGEPRGVWFEVVSEECACGDGWDGTDEWPD